MASGWAYFRKHWIKPEVYPLIGSMAAALGVCGTVMLSKARDPTIGWNKSKRKSDLYQDVEEVVPLWSTAKNNSTRIFGSSREIMETKKSFTELPDPVTVKIGDADEEEEEEDEAPASETDSPSDESAPVEQQSAPAAAEANTSDAVSIEAAVDVIDESAETINAVIDTAIQATVDAAEQAASVAESSTPSAQSAPAQS